MIEQLILAVGVSCLLSRLYGLDSYIPLFVFALPTLIYAALPHGSGIPSYIIPALFDGAIITMMYLMPYSVKCLSLTKDLVIITLISFALNIVGLALCGVIAPVWLDQAYIVLYIVALISIVTRIGYGLGKGDGLASFVFPSNRSPKLCTWGANL